jgi:hypothetical protein
MYSGESFLMVTLISLFGRKGPVARGQNVGLLEAPGKLGEPSWPSSVNDASLSSIDEHSASLDLQEG